jgi:hypothetical protein
MPVTLYEILRTLCHVLECLYAQHISDVVTVVCLVLLIACSTFLFPAVLFAHLLSQVLEKNGKIGVSFFMGLGTFREWRIR